MCGRYTLTTNDDLLRDVFDLADLPERRARYNVAPTQEVLGIVAGPTPPDGVAGRRAGFFRWGLVPSWAKDPKIGARMINARSETASKKPSFRAAFKRRRCLIPADGFFEWQKLEGGGKQPMWIRARGGRPFAMAGLWERWSPDAESEGIVTCTVLTTSPNELLAPIHDRMPVILPPQAWDLWMDRRVEGGSEIEELLVACPAQDLEVSPVSTRVNAVGNDDPACVAPVG